MYRYAVVVDNRVVDVCIWDGVSPCEAFEGCIMVRSPLAAIGDLYDPITKTIYNPGDYRKAVGEYQLGE